MMLTSVMMTAASLALLAAVGQGTTVGQQAVVGASARTEPDTALLGQPVELTVTLTDLPRGAEIIYPQLPDSGIVTALSPPRPLEREGLSRTVRYRVVGWALGDLQVTLDDIIVVTPAAELRVPGPTTVIHVRSTLPEGADPDTLAWRPASGVVGPNWSLGEKAAAVLLALAILAAVVAYARRRAAPTPVPVPPARPPHQRALEALERLEASGLLAAGEFKAFYSEIAEVLRRFLVETDARWGLDLTTMELLPTVANGGVGGKRLAWLGGILSAADMVKFARKDTTRQRAARLLDSARLWIREFQRLPAIAPGPALAEPGEPMPDLSTDVTTLMAEFFAELDEASLEEPMPGQEGPGMSAPLDEEDRGSSP